MPGDATLPNALAATSPHLAREFVQGPFTEIRRTAQDRPVAFAAAAVNQFSGPNQNNHSWPFGKSSFLDSIDPISVGQHQYHMETIMYNAKLHPLIDLALAANTASGPWDLMLLRALAYGSIPADGCIVWCAPLAPGSRRFFTQMKMRDVGCTTLGADALSLFFDINGSAFGITQSASNMSGPPSLGFGNVGTLRSLRQAAPSPPNPLAQSFQHTHYNVICARSGLVTHHYNVVTAATSEEGNMLSIFRPYYTPRGSGVGALAGPCIRLPLTAPEYSEKMHKIIEVALFWLRTQPPEAGCLFLHKMMLDDGHTEYNSQKNLHAITFHLEDLNFGLHRTDAECRENFDRLGEYINLIVFGPPIYGTSWNGLGQTIKDGPRFRAVLNGGPRRTNVLRMSDINNNQVGGTAQFIVGMYSNDPLTCDGTPRHKKEFINRAIRFFDFLGPCVCPAKLYKWCLFKGISGQLP